MEKEMIKGDLADKHEFDLCVEMLSGCLTQFASGDDYIDLDVLESKVGSRIPKLLVGRIRKLQKNYYKPFNKIMLIEKDAGPVGMIPYYGSLVMAMGKKGPQVLVLRSKKRLKRGKIAGGQKLTEKDSVLIVDDVAMTGWTINRSVHEVIGLGASVAGAMVLFERSCGATESLANSGIDLFSIFSFEQIMKNEKMAKTLSTKGIVLRKTRKTIFEFGTA